MKKMGILAGLLLLLGGGIMGKTPANEKLVLSTQEVMNLMINNPNVMVVTGRILDAETRQPITDAKINFDKFGDELIKAAIDKNGNYALAIQKTEIGDPISIIFKVEGYHKYVASNIRKTTNVVDLDLKLQPESSKELSSGTRYMLNDDPFNTLVIKF